MLIHFVGTIGKCNGLRLLLTMLWIFGTRWIRAVTLNESESADGIVGSPHTSVMVADADARGRY